jgi:GT2 family glycosyltransferase
MGISKCLNYGVNLCSNELIFRMDSDDVMVYNRIIKQLRFMIENPECVLCGTGIIPFVDTREERKFYDAENNHPEILTYKEYLSSKHFWILNHPTLCFKKYAVLEVGNYNPDFRLPFEDLDLEVRILKKYGFLCNIKEELLLYRVHTEQITYHHRNNNDENDILKSQLIERIIQG